MADIEFSSVMEAADIKLVFNSFADSATSAAKGKQALSNNFKPKSIASLARDQIMTFPIYMSGDVPAEAGVTMIKAIEKQYSVFAMLALSNRLNYSSDEYMNIGDVIDDIHKNEDSPDLLRYVLRLGNNVANISNIFESIVMAKSEYEAMKYNQMDEITTESINDKYKPNEYAITRVERVTEGILEDNAKDLDKVVAWAQSTKTPNKGLRGTDFKGKGVIPFDEKYFGGYAGSLVPTLVSATITVDGKPRIFMLAIKGTAHVVPRDQMDSMLVDAVHNNELAFKIIKWSKGETRFFRDFIFGIKDARSDAVAMRSANAWLPALKRRKMASKAFVGGGAPVSPISTLIITDIDVENVKAATGIDISRPVVARKMIKDYFLLGLMIYNTQDQTIMTMLDADVNPGWANTTLAGLKSSTIKSGSGKMEIDTKDVLKMLGRY